MTSLHIHTDSNDDKVKAVALGYDQNKDEAPRVLASGKNKIAEQIIAVAKQNGIPIRDDPVLTAALMEIDINQTIPPELYRVVAEVLSYIYRIQHKTGKVNN
ncbi:MAG: EscU/YscU/HrcU family type III secretion system export apparatus switch protein [Anaerolineaceae bacterium]|nr:EscU/YscU/HrcU family type III secretion system export apparatus switch protein [Anaerolineaceae bacterium]